jgi:site-specific DNA recombinase
LLQQFSIRSRTQPKLRCSCSSRNPLYIGVIRHKGKDHPGEHPPILDQTLWDQAQAILAEDARLRASQTMTRHDNEAILRGLLFAPDGDRMLPTATKMSARV